MKKDDLKHNVIQNLRVTETLKSSPMKDKAIKAFESVLTGDVNSTADLVALNVAYQDALSKQGVSDNMAILATYALFASVPKSWVPKTQEVDYGKIGSIVMKGVTGNENSEIIKLKQSKALINQSEVDKLKGEIKRLKP